MSADQASRTWAPGVRIRPSGSDGALDVVDVVSGRTARYEPRRLARLVLDGAPVGWDRTALPVPDALVDGWRHWIDRGWHPADDLYIASRRMNPPPATAVAAAAPPPLAAEPSADGDHEWIALPAASADRRPLAEVLVGRRTLRVFDTRPIALADLSVVLSRGLSALAGRPRSDGAAGSTTGVAAALGPWAESWVVGVIVYNVDGLTPGVYRYDTTRHRVRVVDLGEHRDDMVSVLQGMRTPKTAAWTIALLVDTHRHAPLAGGNAALRQLYVAAGAIAQELIVAGEHLGLATLPTPAQRDSDLLALLGADRDRHAPVYTLTMGGKRPTSRRQRIHAGVTS